MRGDALGLTRGGALAAAGHGAAKHGNGFRGKKKPGHLAATGQCKNTVSASQCSRFSAKLMATCRPTRTRWTGLEQQSQFLGENDRVFRGLREIAGRAQNLKVAAIVRAAAR